MNAPADRPDLVVVNSGSSNVSVLLNTSTFVGINQQTVSQSVAAGQNEIFSVTASGSGAQAPRSLKHGIMCKKPLPMASREFLADRTNECRVLIGCQFKAWAC
jgi:hypothetical protein